MQDEGMAASPREDITRRCAEVRQNVRAILFGLLQRL
jgi:hypothetical protein